MAMMLMRFVQNLDLGRIEFGVQLLCYPLLYARHVNLSSMSAPPPV
jgi:hypothetical protein